MQAIFSEEEIGFLDTKSWWVACNYTPYLIRMAVFKQNLLLCICDLKNLWVTRVDKPTLLKQKEVYAKTMEVSGFSQLITLFKQILSNPETKALYHFYSKNEEVLTFKIEKQIEVYPFQWKFQLISVPCNIPQLLCRDLLNPTIRTLHAQAKRFEIMKKKMEILQRDLLKKMSEPEKKMYKSVLLEDQEDLRLLISEPKEEQFICDLRLDSTSTKLFNTALQLTATKTKHVPDSLNREGRPQKVQAKVSAYEQPKGEQLINQLQMKKQQEKVRKKKKPFDFL